MMRRIWGEISLLLHWALDREQLFINNQFATVVNHSNGLLPCHNTSVLGWRFNTMLPI